MICFKMIKEIIVFIIIASVFFIVSPFLFDEVSYNTMDSAILNLQFECIKDLLNDRLYVDFCDEFQNETKILSLYNWSDSVD